MYEFVPVSCPCLKLKLMKPESWMTPGFAFAMGSGNKVFTEMLPALRVSDRALERQEVCYFQPCSGERSVVYAEGGTQRVRLT